MNSITYSNSIGALNTKYLTANHIPVLRQVMLHTIPDTFQAVKQLMINTENTK